MSRRRQKKPPKYLIISHYNLIIHLAITTLFGSDGDLPEWQCDASFLDVSLYPEDEGQTGNFTILASKKSKPEKLSKCGTSSLDFLRN